MAVLELEELGLDTHCERKHVARTFKRKRVASGARSGLPPVCAPSIDWDSLRKVRAIAIDFIAWFAACGPIACSVGQSTGARAWAAMSIATSRGLLLLPIFVRLLPLAMRSKKVFDM